MKVYASISGGKDSLAALITHMERGGQCDGAIYCRIMFDDETSAEVPEHEEWLHSKCFPLLEREYGIKTQIVQGKYTYTDCFYKQYEKGGKVGKIWGFPFLRGAWCNTRLKVRPIQAHIKTYRRVYRNRRNCRRRNKTYREKNGRRENPPSRRVRHNRSASVRRLPVARAPLSRIQRRPGAARVLVLP